MVVSFTFEMDLDKYVIKRDGYTILDMLSDIGGIQAVLYSFFAVLVSVSSYKNFDNTLASKLFMQFWSRNNLEELDLLTAQDV